MRAIYLSGTGNTKHIVELLMSELGENDSGVAIESEQAAEALKDDEILLAYPTQYSNIPYMVREYIEKNALAWKGKKVFLLTTMGLFAGDGTGCAARLLKKYGTEITGGLQIKMPDSICDVKALKRPMDECINIIKASEEKIREAAKAMKSGNYPKEGLSFPAHLAGLFGQRLWFYNKTTGYTDKLKIDTTKCSGCGLCAKNCPMDNIKVVDGKAKAGGKCTMCYRCAGNCPREAITLIGKQVVAQVGYDLYDAERKK